MFLKIGVLTDFAIFTGKHLCWSLCWIKLQTWRTLIEHFSTLGTTVPEDMDRRNGNKYIHNMFSYNYMGSPTQADHNSWIPQYSDEKNFVIGNV